MGIIQDSGNSRSFVGECLVITKPDLHEFILRQRRREGSNSVLKIPPPAKPAWFLQRIFPECVCNVPACLRAVSRLKVVKRTNSVY